MIINCTAFSNKSLAWNNCITPVHAYSPTSCAILTLKINQYTTQHRSDFCSHGFLFPSSNAFTGSNLVHVQATYAGSRPMSSAYQKKREGTTARSETKTGQSQSFKKNKNK